MARHRRFNSSGAYRWTDCTASLSFVEALIADKKISADDKPSKDAQRGTACHSLLEYALKNNCDPFLLPPNLVKKIAGFDLVYTDLVNVRYIWQYLENEIIKYDAFEAEMNLDLSHIYNADAGGTGDFAAWTVQENYFWAHISDFKNGRMAVEVDANTQLFMYCLGLYYFLCAQMPLLQGEFVLSIGQPNAKHENGRIRETTISLDALLDWEDTKLIPAINAIESGNTVFSASEKNCQWCRGKTFCKAYNDFRTKQAGVDFQDYVKPKMDLPNIIRLLDNAKQIRKDLDEAEAVAIEMLANKQKIPGYELKQEMGNRKLKALPAVKKAFADNGLSVEEITKEKAATLGDIQNYLKTLGWTPQEIDSFIDSITKKDLGKLKLCKKESTAEKDFKEFRKFNYRKR